jgi:hypothetical protein
MSCATKTTPRRDRNANQRKGSEDEIEAQRYLATMILNQLYPQVGLPSGDIPLRPLVIKARTYIHRHDEIKQNLAHLALRFRRKQ